MSHSPPSKNVTCPNCGSSHISYNAVAVGAARCNDCGHAETFARISQSPNNSGDLIGALVALGFIAVGAVLVGSFLDSISGGAERQRRLPTYDEENWKRYLK